MDSQALPRNFQPPRKSVQTPLDTSSVPTAFHDVSDGDGSAPKKRRTSTTTSSRGVANLTPEQLAKKRANDREAQRAIRERTKTQIETLEKQVRDLRNQQPQQELQTVLKQKQLAEAENVQIKKQLSAALSLLQPLLGNQGGGPSASLQVTQDVSTASSTKGRRALSSAPHSHPIPRSVSQISDTASIRTRPSPSPTFPASSPVQQNHSSIQMPTYTVSQSSVYPPGSASLERQRNNLTHGLNISTSGERLNLGFLLEGRDTNQSGGSPHSAHRIPTHPHTPTKSNNNNNNNHQPRPAAVQTPKPHEGFDPPLLAHAVPIRNIPATCPLDVILLDFLTERRARAAEGASPSNLVGPPYPSVSSLLNPERSIYAHPLSKVFTDILSKFPDLAHLPEQVAVLYIMFLIMRWQISPTAENYDRLPEWVTPRASQLFTPHPAWVDHLPWPRMRDKMVSLYPDISLDQFFVPYTTTLSLNWAYEDCDTLLSLPGVGGGEECAINPVFERHLRDLGNWTLGTSFEKAFPELTGTFNIRGDERGKAR